MKGKNNILSGQIWIQTVWTVFWHQKVDTICICTCACLLTLVMLHSGECFWKHCRSSSAGLWQRSSYQDLHRFPLLTLIDSSFWLALEIHVVQWIHIEGVTGKYFNWKLYNFLWLSHFLTESVDLDEMSHIIMCNFIWVLISHFKES